MTNLTRLKLLAVPLLLVLVGAGMALKMFPLYSGGGIYNSDPSYAYLFNGLLLLSQQVPYHIDHPGTPLQTLIALLVSGQWLFLKLFSTVNADVVAAVMAEPERYLLFISRVLLALNALALFYLGKKIYQSTESLFLAIFCQCALLTYGVFGTKLLYPAPEALVAALSLCLLAVLAPLIFQNPVAAKKQSKIAVLAGIFFGLGFAVKLTFLPMAGLFLLLKTRRQLALACVAALVAWLFGILPMISKLPQLFNWIHNMFTHTGKYGGGGKGLIDYSQIASHFTALDKAFPFFYFAVVVFAAYLVVALIIWLVKMRSPDLKQATGGIVSSDAPAVKTIAVLLVVCVVQTLVVLKHFGQHYMLPALPIAFVGIAFIAQRASANKRRFGILLKSALSIAVAVLVIDSTRTAFATLKAERLHQNRSVNSLLRELAKYHNPLIIGSYGCYLPQCGLMFGIEYAPAIDKKIAPYLANFYGFNVWNQMLVIDGHGFYPLSVLEAPLAQQRPILLITKIDFPAFDSFKKDLVLQAEDQKLYKVTGLALPK
jgi:hypothetical protein